MGQSLSWPCKPLLSELKAPPDLAWTSVPSWECVLVPPCPRPIALAHGCLWTSGCRGIPLGVPRQAFVRCLLLLLSLLLSPPCTASALRPGLSDPARSLGSCRGMSVPSLFPLSCCGGGFSRPEGVGSGNGTSQPPPRVILATPDLFIRHRFGCQAAWFGEGLGGKWSQVSRPECLRCWGQRRSRHRWHLWASS